MTLKIDSFSSSLMLGTTLYRNQGGTLNKLFAQGGYGLTAVVSIVETAAALAFSALALVVYPFSSSAFEHTIRWLDSSSFTVAWSLTNFILNPFVTKLVADEKSAREILSSGNLMKIPRNAIH